MAKKGTPREDWKKKAKIFSTNIKNLLNFAIKHKPGFSPKELYKRLNISSSIWSSWANRGSLPRNNRVRERIAEALSDAVGTKFSAHQLINEIIDIKKLEKEAKEAVCTPAPVEKKVVKEVAKEEVPETKRLIDIVSKICEELAQLKKEIEKLPVTEKVTGLSKSEKEYLEAFKKLSKEKQKEVLNYVAFQASRKPS